MKRTLKILLLLFGAVLVGSAPVLGQEQKPPTEDWQKLLAGVRARFANSKDPTLEQTRIDRAYFTLNEDDPDQPPFLNVTGICLRTALDDEKQMKVVLHKELSQIVVPGAKFVLKIDQIQFHDSPIYALQDAAVRAFKANATFNVFFERATYAADGNLQIHVLSLRDDRAPDALTTLLSNNPVAKELTLMPMDRKTKAPSVIPRDFHWPGALQAIRRKFPDDVDPFLQRTRFDDGYLHFSADRKVVHFAIDGVCIHPPALVDQVEREKRWKSPVSGLIPNIKYEPTVNGVVMLANPSIPWQDEAATQEKHDGIFFRLAQFDHAGKLKLTVMLPSDPHRASVRKLITDRPTPAKLLPIDEKCFDFQTWNWQTVIPKAQARLAQGDFLNQRTRLDRIFFKYEPTRGGPILHFDGVSLHPTELAAAEDLRARLERSFKDLPPAPVEHKLHTDNIRFLLSPIYALQTEAIAGNLDGLLFANAIYDDLGKLHLGIVIGTPEQRKLAQKMIEALPMPAGAIRPKHAKDQPVLEFTELAWGEILHDMQRWMAKHNETFFRKTRLERGFFSFPANKIGPSINFAFVGIYPKKDEYVAKLAKRFERYVQLSLTDQLKAGPVAVVPTIENVGDPAPIVQAKIHESPSLDGVRLDDASFDGDGKLIVHGIWVNNKQQPTLEKLTRDVLTPEHTLLKRSFNWGAMQDYDSPGLLHLLRVFVADQQDIDEVWLERFYFDAAGKTKVVGFSTRPQDKDNILKLLPKLLPRIDSKKLPAIEDPEKNPLKLLAFFQEPKDDGPIVLDPLTNIGQHLRDNIPLPANRNCDGLRIDRCFYDPQGVFRIEGLADRDAQTQELKPFLDGNGVPFDQKRQLAKSWNAGRQTVIPLWPMMVSLAENLPSLPEFDGLVLDRAHHDPKNQLVLTGHAIGEPDVKKQTEILKHLLDTHPRWRLRLKFGFELVIAHKKPADADLSRKLTLKGLTLLQVNIGEARVDPLPVSNGWWSHAWPYDERQKRVKPTNEEYDEALGWLGIALRHDPGNTLAWYLRGYILQTLNRSDLTLRDYRRMVDLELDDEDLRHKRILELELVQGRLRQTAFAIERNAILQVSDGWILRSLPESPAAPDKTK